MKRAVIVVGSHNVGKSMTINKYFKPLIGLRPKQRNFTDGRALSQSIEEKVGTILSQTLEEKGLLIVDEFVERYYGFKYLVCAARPESEKGSLLKKLLSKLESRGFQVTIVKIENGKPNSYYKEKAQDILDGLQLQRGNYRPR